MSSKNKNASDKILDLIQTPVLLIDSDEETSAKVVEKDIEDEQEVVLSNSILRKRNAQTLDDEDERYIGKKAARKRLNDDDDDDDNDLQLEYFKQSWESNNSDDDESDETQEEENEESDETQEEEADEEDEDNDSESDFDDTHDDEGLPDYKNGDAETVEHISKGISEERAKGIEVRNQLTTWDNLIECRIQLQKSLLNSNRIPKLDSFENLKKQGGKELEDTINHTTKSISTLLEKLLKLQNLKLNDFSETKNLCDKSKEKESVEDIPSDIKNEEANNPISQKRKGTTEESDEEILSEAEKVVIKSISQKRKRKRKNIEELENVISEQYEQFSTYRNNVIEEWNDKTKVMVGQASNKDFSGFEDSTLRQIEQVLTNRKRLLDRTRLKRSNYEIIGEKKKENITDLDPEIFDDNDFYHQLLRELIERKATDVTDPIQLGRQWLELQKLRSKMKRKIDIKATKGRRIRYNVHKKLVSFMAPKNNKSSWTNESKIELYKSLFGNKT